MMKSPGRDLSGVIVSHESKDIVAQVSSGPVRRMPGRCLFGSRRGTLTLPRPGADRSSVRHDVAACLEMSS